MKLYTLEEDGMIRVSFEADFKPENTISFPKRFKAKETIEGIMLLLERQNAVNSKERAFPMKVEDDPSLYRDAAAAYVKEDYDFLDGVQWMLDRIHAKSHESSPVSDAQIDSLAWDAANEVLSSNLNIEITTNQVLAGLIKSTISKHIHKLWKSGPTLIARLNNQKESILRYQKENAELKHRLGKIKEWIGNNL